MARYVEILAEQYPFQLPDRRNRTVFVFNVTAQATPDVDTWTEDLISILVTAGLGVKGTTLFSGPDAFIPDSDTAGPFVTIIPQAAQRPDGTHNVADGPAYDRLAAQLAVVGNDWSDTRDRAVACYRELDGTRNQTV